MPTKFDENTIPSERVWGTAGFVANVNKNGAPTYIDASGNLVGPADANGHIHGDESDGRNSLSYLVKDIDGYMFQATKTWVYSQKSADSDSFIYSYLGIDGAIKQTTIKYGTVYGTHATGTIQGDNTLVLYLFYEPVERTLTFHPRAGRLGWRQRQVLDQHLDDPLRHGPEGRRAGGQGRGPQGL